MKFILILVLLSTVGFATDVPCPTNSLLSPDLNMCQCGGAELNSMPHAEAFLINWCKEDDAGTQSVQNLENEFGCPLNVLLNSNAIYSNGGSCICGMNQDNLEITVAQMGKENDSKYCKEAGTETSPEDYPEDVGNNFNCPTNVLLDVNAVYANGGSCICGKGDYKEITGVQMGIETGSKYCEEVIGDVALTSVTKVDNEKQPQNIGNKFNCPPDVLLDSNATYSNNGSCICGESDTKEITVEQMNAGIGDKQWCEEEDDGTRHPENLGNEFDCPTDTILDSGGTYSNNGSCICGVRAMKEITVEQMGNGPGKKWCKVSGTENLVGNAGMDILPPVIYLWKQVKGFCSFNRAQTCLQPITVTCLKVLGDNIVGTVSKSKCDVETKPPNDDVHCEENACEPPTYEWTTKIGNCTFNSTQACVKPITITCSDVRSGNTVGTVSNYNCDKGTKPTDVDDIDCNVQICAPPIYVWRSETGSCSLKTDEQCVKPVIVTCINTANPNSTVIVHDDNCKQTRPSDIDVECNTRACGAPYYVWKEVKGECAFNKLQTCVQPLTLTCTSFVNDKWLTVTKDNCNDETAPSSDDLRCEKKFCPGPNYTWKLKRGQCTWNADDTCRRPVTVTCASLASNNIHGIVSNEFCNGTKPSFDDEPCHESQCDDECVGAWTDCFHNCTSIFAVWHHASENGTACLANHGHQVECAVGVGACVDSMRRVRRDLFNDHNEMHLDSRDLSDGHSEMRSKLIKTQKL